MAKQRITRRFRGRATGRPPPDAEGYLGREMVLTPWGHSKSLRERRLPPGRGTPRGETERNQRERLFGAMVAVASTKGYGATSVADLLAVSGVSRKAFYEHFADKESCFLATLEEILSGASAITASRLRRAGSWEERAERSLTSFLELLVAQPAAARLCVVESHAAGPAAVARVDKATAGFNEMMAQALRERPDYGEMPEELLWAMVGGMQRIVHTRLRLGAERELLAEAPLLLQLGLTYRPPPERLRRKRRRGASAIPSEDAPPSADADGWPRDPGERIVRGTLAAVAEKGIGATTVGDIVEAAHISLSTFYEHFDGKAEAFDAALYASRARMVGYGLPIYRRARSWPEGVRALTEFSLSYLASEPEFARLIARDVYAAGPEALARLDRAIEAARRFVDDGVEEYAPQMPPIWREAIISALYAMLCRHVRLEGPESLPEIAPLATYMALAPFLGPEAACEVANGERPRAANS